MLKGIDPRLSPELLYLLARMGHGDDLAIVDSNHPAETVAASTVTGAWSSGPYGSLAYSAGLMTCVASVISAV